MSLDEPTHYAGFWRRAGAHAIDAVLFTLIVGVLQMLVNGLPDLNQTVQPDQVRIWTSGNVIEQVAMLGITVVLWVRFLGTPGKLLLSCQVVDANTGGPLTFKQALLRYLGYFLSMLPLFLGFLWVAWDKRKQGFHDKLAGTVVIIDGGTEVDDESAKSLEQLMEEAR